VIHHQEPQQTTDTEAAPLALSKYGRFVSHVEDFLRLVGGLELKFIYDGDLIVGDDTVPSTSDLTRHFFKRCPNAPTKFQMICKYTESADLFQLVLEILPRVRTLCIRSCWDEEMLFPVREFEKVIAAASNNLHSLTINVTAFEETTISAYDPEITARPKHLSLRCMSTGGGVRSSRGLVVALEHVRSSPRNRCGRC